MPHTMLADLGRHVVLAHDVSSFSPHLLYMSPSRHVVKLWLDSITPLVILKLYLIPLSSHRSRSCLLPCLLIAPVS